MTHPTPLTRLGAALAAIALSLGVAACSGEDSEPPTQDAADTDDITSPGPAAGGFPVTVDAENGEVTIQTRPERIVSLSPSTTEILFAIGAGDQVVAVDEFSTYPETAPITDLSGYDPNIEAVVGYQPDLVLVSNDSNDLVASLEALDVPVMVNGAPSDLEGGYDIVAALGQATGQVDGAAGVVSGMRSSLDEAFAAAPQDTELRVYHELDATYFSASSNSFIGSVYERMGAVNIADEADVDGTGYPQLTEEAVVAADPQLIIITDQVGYTAEDVAARPGWSEVSAVRNGGIVTVDADIASRWGPRLPQLVELLADAMATAAVPAGR
jgi:iron complex transport system substrate-binding protein